ncbi:RNA binding protein-like protein, putative, partial [Chondrus crispus]
KFTPRITPPHFSPPPPPPTASFHITAHRRRPKLSPAFSRPPRLVPLALVLPSSRLVFIMAEEGNRLFVGNLSWGTNDQSLHEAFDKGSGTVVEAKVIIDRYSGRSRGFGFVTFNSADQAAEARDSMNGAEVDGRAVRVDVASSSRR